jgi:hypothetical protein
MPKPDSVHVRGEKVVEAKQGDNSGNEGNAAARAQAVPSSQRPNPGAYEGCHLYE